MALPSTQKNHAIKAWICLALIVATTIFAFLPIITIDLDAEMVSEVEKFASDKLGININYKTSESKAEVSSFSVISGIKIIIKTAKVLKTKSAENIKALEETLFESDGHTLKGGAAKTLALIAASYNAMGLSSEQETKGLAKGMTILLTGVAILYVLIFILFAPFAMLILAISAIIRIARANGEYNDLATNLGDSLLGKLSFPILLLIFKCLIPGFKLTIGGIGVLCCTILGFAVCMVFTRLRKYVHEDGKYVNLLQICSLGALVGYALFLIFITRTGATRSFLTGTWPAAMYASIDSGSANAMYIIEGVMMLLAATFVVSSVKVNFNKNISRMTLSRDPVPNAKATVKNPEALLGSTIAMLTIPLFPLIISFIKNDPLDESFLKLEGSQTAALIVAAVGIVIMVASEIVLIKLKPKLAPSVNPDRVLAIISGQSKTKKEKNAQEKSAPKQAPAAKAAEEAAAKAAAEEAAAAAAPEQPPVDMEQPAADIDQPAADIDQPAAAPEQPADQAPSADGDRE